MNSEINGCLKDKDKNNNNIIIERELNQNILLNKKIKSNNAFILNNENKKEKKEIKKDVKEYEFGYSIILLEEKEKGLMENFLEEPDISDYYNYHLNEEKFQKILHHSKLVHYERYLKEEMEKRKKIKNMFMLNMNINMNMNNIPPSIMPQMNSIMIENMNNNENSLNYPMQISSIQNINNKIKNPQNLNDK